MMILSSALLFAGTLLLFFGIVLLVNERSSRLRLGRLSAGAQSETEVGIFQADESLLVRLLTPLAGSRGQGRSARGAKKLRERLSHAGHRSPVAVVMFRGLRVVLLAVLPLMLFLTPLRLFVSENLLPATAAAMAGLGYILPSYLLDRLIKHRSREIERHLPTALDLLAVCIEAGLGLIQGLSRVGQEIRRISPVLAEEIGLVNLATGAGRSNTEALRELAQRTNVREVSVLVSMLTQTERFGTSLAVALRTHSDSMRIRRTQLSEERAAKATLRMLFPTAIILLALLVLIMGLAAVHTSKILGTP
ncbi:MAG: type II secretion system F family protein [Myxococcales bacterium]|nr:type II secretion system F family protein [Myxococcales bacterium]